MDTFGYLNSSLYFYFVTNHRKNLMAQVRLQLNPTSPSPPIQASTLSRTTPSPSERRYFMDDPKVDLSWAHMFTYILSVKPN